jgi:excisionase family DNA binding protein
MDKLLTPKQLSDILHIKLSTVYKWVHYGYIPYLKIGSLTRFKESKIMIWLKKRENKGRNSYKIDIKTFP